MKTLIAILSVIFLCETEVSAAESDVLTELHGPCSTNDECGSRQVCRDLSCQCRQGHLPWLGQCVPARSHGQDCSRQIECTMSNDPNLKCVMRHGGKPGQCQCRGGYDFDQGRGRCFPSNDDSQAEERPSHIRLEPRDGYKVVKKEGEDDGAEPSIIELEKNLEGIYERARNRQKKKDNGDHPSWEDDALIFGPISLAVAAMVVIALCVCFWSAKTPSLREDAYTVRGVESGPDDDQTYRSAKNLAEGLSVGQGVMVIPPSSRSHSIAASMHGLSPPAALRQHHDNAGFDHDFDALSGHLTTQTEVCEASHAEYIDNVLQRHVADAALDAAGYESNIKMIFKHSQEVSLTPSMDDADAEVAGIYKAYSSNVDPLAARIEQISVSGNSSNSSSNGSIATNGNNINLKVETEKTPPPVGAKRTVELVDTDECTSIDTTIPEDEVASFQRGVERQKELNLEDSIKEETDEEISKEQQQQSMSSSDSDDSSSNVNNNIAEDEIKAPETPRAAQDCAEFVDSVFKPVFSIS